MMKLFSISFLLLACLIKTSAQKGIENLINAEKNFAAYSVANSTKEAFLKFLDSAGIVFDNGKPVNGIETWNKREKRPGVLNWYPQYAEIAASGDFGYTTGPWTFQNSLHDTIAARGQYTTVWHITKNGEWKFLVDLGVSNTPENSISKTTKIDIYKPATATAAIPHISPLISAENNFQELVARDKAKAYKEFLSAGSILNRNGYLPSVGMQTQKMIIDSTSATIQYKIDGSGISESQDIGYVFGTTVINGKTDNYLRIWRREKDGWKIALEVLRY